MPTAILVVATCCACAIVASWFMWWATRRSALWAMAAGALLGLVAVGCAVAIAWLLTRARLYSG